MTSKVFLIVNVASVKSTDDTFTFGSCVNRVPSETGANSVVRTLRSVTSKAEDGRNPLEIPETEVVADTVKLVVPTLTTLAKMGSSVSPAVVSVYSTKSFSLIKLPGKSGFLVVIVLIPPERALTVAIPTLNLDS